MQDDPRTFRWQEEMAKMAACRRVLVGLLQCLAVRQFARTRRRLRLSRPGRFKIALRTRLPAGTDVT